MAIAAKRYLERGLAALQRGDNAGAIEALTSASQLVPAYAPVSQWLVVAHARAGGLSEAIAVAQGALARGPRPRDATWLWLLLAEVMLAAGRARAATEAYAQASAAAAAAGPDWSAEVVARRVAMGRARMAAAQGLWPAALASLLQTANAPRSRQP